MMSFSLRTSIHFLVQTTSLSCIQSTEISPDKFISSIVLVSVFTAYLSNFTELTYTKRAAISCFEANRLILQWNGEPYLGDVVKVEAGISENTVKN